jgi:hypothetical protein
MDWKCRRGKTSRIKIIPQAKTRMEPSTVIFLSVIIAAIGILWWISKSGSPSVGNKTALVNDANRYLLTVKEQGALPQVPSNINLKAGESAFYSTASTLYETRSVRNYQSGGGGVRVAKGIYVGGSKGRSTSSQEWSKIDSGALTVTNKRLTFEGAGETRSFPISKILSSDSSSETVQVSIEGRQKALVFSAPNPLILATILRICCQADPLNLSETNLDITFT